MVDKSKINMTFSSSSFQSFIREIWLSRWVNEIISFWIVRDGIANVFWNGLIGFTLTMRDHTPYKRDPHRVNTTPHMEKAFFWLQLMIFVCFHNQQDRSLSIVDFPTKCHWFLQQFDICCRLDLNLTISFFIIKEIWGPFIQAAKKIQCLLHDIRHLYV